jgi:hypothetical protein
MNTIAGVDLAKDVIQVFTCKNNKVHSSCGGDHLLLATQLPPIFDKWGYGESYAVHQATPNRNRVNGP